MHCYKKIPLYFRNNFFLQNFTKKVIFERTLPDYYYLFTSNK